MVIAGAQVFGKDALHQKAGLASKIAAVVAIAFLTSTSVGYAFHSGRGDVAGAAVIAFELLAIFTAHRHPAVIHWCVPAHPRALHSMPISLGLSLTCCFL